MSEVTIAEIRAKAAEHYNGTTGFDNNSRRNAYECEACQSYIVTVDREPGVTPFMVGCGNCSGTAKSKFYKVADWLEPTHEWYRPDTLHDLALGVADHVKNGGLLLRRIGGGDKKQGWLSPDTLRANKVEARIRDIVDAEIRMAEQERGDEKLSAMQRELARIEKRQRELLKKLAEPCPLKREDYPSRQAYRNARRKWRA